MRILLTFAALFALLSPAAAARGKPKPPPRATWGSVKAKKPKKPRQPKLRPPKVRRGKAKPVEVRPVGPR